ncbi:MAG TPA: hypothetical protein VGJ81_22125 [Thermoanaerobaculia bacterium]|jgi:hypothetical protein
MNKYLVALELDALASEGQLLREVTFTDNVDRVRVWLARSRDVIALVLPENSRLLKEFDETHDLFLKKGLNTLPPTALMVIHSASTINRARRDDALAAELRDEMNSIALQTYSNSLPFRATIGLLALTAGFAILGVFQLNNFKVDVRERAETAARKAEQEIEQQKVIASKAISAISVDARQEVERQLKSELQSHVTDTKRGITVAAQSYIDDLKRQKAPELEAALLVSRMNLEGLRKQLLDTQQRLAQVEEKSNTLKRGLDQMRKVTAGSSILDKLSAFLDRSRGYVAGEIVAIACALLLALFATCFSVYKLRRARW